jgi:hypothetical protein
MSLVYKKCSGCKKKLPVTEFWKEPKGKFGVRHKCKQCEKKYKAKTKNRNRKVNYARTYKGPKFIEIKFCKDCGKLLIHKDTLYKRKGVPNKIIGTYLEKCVVYDNGWEHKICNNCDSKRKNAIFEKKWKLKKRKKEKKEKRMKDIRYCSVCCQAFSCEFPAPEKIRGMELDEFEHSPYSFWYDGSCSKECCNKIKYVLDIPQTGMKGVGKTTFNIMYAHSISNLEYYHEQYKMALTVKEYLELKRLRIKTKKEIKNGIA